MNQELAGISIAVIGGDARELILVQELLNQGASIKAVGLPPSVELEGVKTVNSIAEAINNVDVVILPMTGTDSDGKVRANFGKEPLVISESVFSILKPETILLVGIAKKILKNIALKYKLKIIETANLDNIAILNSIPTAEGAIQVAMENLPVTIHGCKTLVLGFGRCGATLARTLKALGAEVCVAARKDSDLAKCYTNGIATVTYAKLNQHLPEFELVFNTVPELVLDHHRIALLNRNCLIVDIATAPGGIDFSAAEKMGIKAILAPSLPGRVAPKTAGKILADTYPRLILREISKDFRRCNDEIGR